MAGKIMLEGGGVIDCMIRNRSDTGARLKVATVIGVPASFLLLIEFTGEQRQAETVWHKETDIGIRFL